MQSQNQPTQTQEKKLQRIFPQQNLLKLFDPDLPTKSTS